MKLHDSILGGSLILVAAAMWFTSDALPNPTMQPYGPGFFPKILAAFLFATSLILCIRRVTVSQPLITLADWAREPKSVMRVLLVPVAVVLFVMTTDSLGFIPAAILMVWAMMAANEVRPMPALLASTLVVMLVHSIFYLGLNVQLPWGVLQPVRW